MDKEVKNIALVIKTDSLEYDDRVRKEILSIQKLYPNIKFKIFAMLQENVYSEGINGYGVPFKSVFIPSRNKYPSTERLWLKAYEFYKFVRKDLKKFDAVWCADATTALFVLCINHKPLIWDLHELPSLFLKNNLTKNLLKYMFWKCKVVVHANYQRIKYLESVGVIKGTTKHYALRNFPNFNDKDHRYDDKYYQFLQWKGDRKCVYLQGISSDERAAFESLSAVLSFTDLSAVVIGSFVEDIKERLINKYGLKELDKRIFFVGKIAQLKIPQYVQLCFMSLVFYKNTCPNNFYCEANRFYQSVLMGMPVVVGNNPSMKELVEKYNFGVSIDDDGSSVEKIIVGINKLLSNYEFYHQNNLEYRNNLIWDQQSPNLKKIVDKLIYN